MHQLSRYHDLITYCTCHFKSVVLWVVCLSVARSANKLTMCLLQLMSHRGKILLYYVLTIEMLSKFHKAVHPQQAVSKNCLYVTKDKD